MTKIPLFSIIVPLYNKEQYLEACLKSLQEQTEQSWECIIVNDGSTDDSESIAKRFEREDTRFKVLSQKNAGPSVARNYGIRVAKGKLLHFMDADDYYPLSTSLEQIGAIYNKNHPMAIAGNILVFYSVNGITDDTIPVNSKEVKRQTFTELQNDYYFTRFFFDRKFIEKYKVTFPEYTYVGEDPVFLVKALSKMDNFLITDIPVYTYRQVAGSGSEVSVYNEAKLISYMTTQLEILEICREHNYTRLKKRILDRIDHETLDLYMKYKDQKRELSDGLKKILTYIDEEIHHERVLSAREREAYAHNLEVITDSLRAEVATLKQPGIKRATKLLIEAMKRKVKKMHKTHVEKA